MTWLQLQSGSLAAVLRCKPAKHACCPPAYPSTHFQIACLPLAESATPDDLPSVYDASEGAAPVGADENEPGPLGRAPFAETQQVCFVLLLHQLACLTLAAALLPLPLYVLWRSVSPAIWLSLSADGA